jgi:hypothetical protein
MGKTSRRNQKLYKMKGCSKNKTCKNHLGGSADINLAYPSNNVPTSPNPFLAYTGKGGMPATYMPVNTNAADKTIPNTGPAPGGFNFLNPQGLQHGGGCGDGMCPLAQSGGGCGCGLMKGGCGDGTCGAPGFMVGGKKHRQGCKCSKCKSKMQKGGLLKGGLLKGGLLKGGAPYPNGLVGSAWTPSSSGWPGVDGVQGDRNFLALNEYKVDPQTALISTGANPPFSIGGRRRSRKQKGGALSNFLGQDLINLGRQFQFGVGSAYNALTGFSAPVSPLPWRDQIPSAANISTIKASNI